MLSFRRQASEIKFNLNAPGTATHNRTQRSHTHQSVGNEYESTGQQCNQVTETMKRMISVGSLSDLKSRQTADCLTRAGQHSNRPHSLLNIDAQHKSATSLFSLKHQAAVIEDSRSRRKIAAHKRPLMKA